LLTHGPRSSNPGLKLANASGVVGDTLVAALLRCVSVV
jgi:hypothetical protein